MSGCEGFFAPQVPLHAELQYEKGFGELLEAVKKEVESVRAHGTYARDLLLRDPSLRSALAQQRDRSTPLAIERVRQISDRGPDANGELVVAIPDDGEECAWWYDEGLFDGAAIARMQEQFATLWNEIGRTAENPEQKIGELTLLSPGEREQILVEWNGSKVAYPCEKCVHQLFEEQVARTPNAAAVVFENQSLSYVELNRRANQLAHYLRGLGVKPDERVAICVERSFEMVVALLAVLKAGGAYVPLDPAYPVERLRFMLQDSAPVALLTQHHLEVLFSGISDKLPVLDMTAVVCAWGGQPETNPDSTGIGLNQRNLAYINYTSGSTGQPKGVMVEHYGLRNLILWFIEEFEFSSRDASLIVTSTSFDLTYKNIYAPILVGGRIHLVRNLFDPQMILSEISGGDISFMNLTPTAYGSLIDADENHELSKMRRVFFGGEPIQPGKLLKVAKPRPEFVNTYGPTECTGITAFFRIRSEIEQWTGRPVPIGHPLSNARVYILDAHGQPVPVGVCGELHIGGAGVSRGYLNRPELTAEKFVHDPFVSEPGARMYRTGDLGRWLADGTIEFLGRNDFQVKIRGFRIELGEIEARLSKHPGVREAVVVARTDAAGDKCLVAYYTSAVEQGPISTEELRSHLFAALPEYMVPAAYVRLKYLPVTPSGKLDRKALPAPEADAFAIRSYEPPRDETEQKIAAIWQEALGVPKVGSGDNFFDLGGDSLRLMRVQVRLRQAFNKDIAMVDMFRFTTVRALAQHLAGESDSSLPDQVHVNRELPNPAIRGIAVIGMAARVPRATNVEQFWKNLCSGVESVTTFTDEQLLSAGVDPSLVQSPNYVKTGILLEEAEYFDAKFFGYTPKEAELTDPQQRIFLECAWESLEDAGYDPERTRLRIGVFAGTGKNLYFQNNLVSNPGLIASLNSLQKTIAIDADYVSTRVSYKLNLKGPSLTVLTACSTSLVASHLACQSLRNGECDMALAGGVFIRVPQREGYLYEEGSLESPDGRCRAFDASAKGMVFGNGAGVVVLKRLADAVRDGDSIHAVILGSAINNDGADKIGYTAPGMDGQASVIAEAQALAGVSADDVSYVEAHGTGTVLGDPIEVAGLTRAFRRTSEKNGFCALGSVKTNIGHLDAAAGVAGLIKVVLALKNRMLPPSLNFKEANPAIDFANSPFFVQQTLEEWKPASGRRVAGVSSFGIGGTNAHVIVEEAPPSVASEQSKTWQLLPLAAKTPEALEKATERLADYLAVHPDLSLADAAFTLQMGRKPFAQRRIVAAKSVEEAVGLLKRREQGQVFSGVQPQFDSPIAFMFTGQAAQYVNMGHEIYRDEKRFRESVDRCCEFLKPHLGVDLRRILYPEAKEAAQAAAELNQTAMTQPAMFVVEYALARLWMDWGVVPEAMIGHSIGEYVAACLGGVFSLEDALTLVAGRGRLMQSMPRGSMLAVRLDEQSLRSYLGEGISLAVINGISATVAAGPADAIEDLQKRLTEKSIDSTPLTTSHAFHSRMMEPILGPFRELFKGVQLSSPKIPFLSNVTGTWIEAGQATDPNYWSTQLRQTVRFSDGVGELLKTPNRILLEVGPGRTLSSLSKQHPGKAPEQQVLSSFGYTKGGASELGELMTTLGRLWIAGVAIDWQATSAGQQRHRVSLPTYPFERKRYWIEARRASRAQLDLSPIGGQRIESSLTDESGGAGAADMQSMFDVNLASREAGDDQRTDLEKVLAGVWREVLGFEKIGVDENFFDLGGESLLGTRVISRLRATFRMELPPSSLFEAPTIGELALYMIAHEPKQGLVEKTAAILQQIESMTEEELLEADGKEEVTHGEKV